MPFEELPTVPADPEGDGILWDVVEQHFDEAEFQSEAFERALESAIHTLETVAKGPERSLFAHLDGLAVNGAAVVERVLMPALAEPDPAYPSKTVAAGLALIQAGQGHQIRSALVQDAALVRQAAARAGGLSASHDLDRWVVTQMASTRVPTEVAGLLAYVTERRLPTAGPLFAWLHDADPVIAAAAARAVPWSDFRAHLPALEDLLRRPEPEVREAARLPALCAGSQVAWADCEAAALAPTPSASAACLYAALGGPSEHAKLVGRLESAEAK
ncbi:MAG TPA: hypothetical protein VGF45_05010, partial [Polyangia bacterium]